MGNRKSIVCGGKNRNPDVTTAVNFAADADAYPGVAFVTVLAADTTLQLLGVLPVQDSKSGLGTGFWAKAARVNTENESKK